MTQRNDGTGSQQKSRKNESGNDKNRIRNNRNEKYSRWYKKNIIKIDKIKNIIKRKDQISSKMKWRKLLENKR